MARSSARGEANKAVAAAAQAARAATPSPPRQPRPQHPSVAVNPSEVLHQSGVTMVDGTLGPLTTTEARAFNDVVGEFGASNGGIQASSAASFTGHYDTMLSWVFLGSVCAFSFYMNDDWKSM